MQNKTICFLAKISISERNSQELWRRHTWVFGIFKLQMIRMSSWLETFCREFFVVTPRRPTTSRDWNHKRRFCKKWNCNRSDCGLWYLNFVVAGNLILQKAFERETFGGIRNFFLVPAVSFYLTFCDAISSADCSPGDGHHWSSLESAPNHRINPQSN